MHVLLVEPDKVQARTYVAALERVGHSIAHATGAQSAVQAADAQTPDIVVLELQLPGHNGVEFLYEFRSYPEWLRVPVLLHTFTPPHELSFAATLQKELGVRRILYKPTTTLADLCAAVYETAQPEAYERRPTRH
jgi:CheY-like chemotaxis protein